MKKQIDFIDTARGIGIFLVVLGHCITKDMAQRSMVLFYIRLFIYTIHMPLFFVISGWLFENNKDRYLQKSTGTYIKSKFKAFMIPYLTFSILVYAIVQIVLSFIPQLASLLNRFGYYRISFWNALVQIGTYEGHQDSHLWFCYTMFLLLCLNRILINRKLSQMLCVSGILFFMLPLFSPFVPELIWRVCKYMFLFTVGRVSYRKIKYKNYPGLFAAAIMIVSLAIYGYLYKKLGTRNSNWFLPVAEISSTFFILFYMSNHIKAKRIGKTLTYFGSGKTSFAIYLIHMPFLTSAQVFIAQNIGMPDVVTICLVSILVIWESLILYRVISRFPVLNKIMFGAF